jgi:thioesterase domain-containing protein
MPIALPLSESALADLRAAFAAMPPVAAMGVEVAHYDGTRLRLRAPLARNVNDKGCAFGGSLNGVMTIAAWGLGFLKLAEAGQRADTYVQDSSIRYLAPLYGDIVAEAWLSPGQDWDGYIAQLAARGRARAAVSARVVGAAGADAATFEGRFVALRGN